ncbi:MULTISPECIES: hypothetical protein [Paraburkholderia]|uniref:Uncharacterized protein n=2 Tax=Paraburkholderia TaxID=1822464 RepID=A0A7Y9WUH5_9BURK|nr:hypothetical protein [Paraburkholderia bryophila]NYH26580.1 hypothetical protein [Paraburkholderia bryophila]
MSGALEAICSPEIESLRVQLKEAEKIGDFPRCHLTRRGAALPQKFDKRHFVKVSSGKTRTHWMRCATVCSVFRRVCSGVIARRRTGLLAGDPGMTAQFGDT